MLSKTGESKKGKWLDIFKKIWSQIESLTKVPWNLFTGLPWWWGKYIKRCNVNWWGNGYELSGFHSGLKKLFILGTTDKGFKDSGSLGASNQQDHVKFTENREEVVIFAKKRHFWTTCNFHSYSKPFFSDSPHFFTSIWVSWYFWQNFVEKVIFFLFLSMQQQPTWTSLHQKSIAWSYSCKEWSPWS